MKIKLSDRLSAVAEMVICGETVADIGTDHGYLPVYLIVEGMAPSVIATDRAKAPLAAARQLVELLSLNKKIDVRLGEGISVLLPGEAHTVCIAGMGGMTIRDILQASPNVTEATKRFVLQPQRNAAALRLWLVENGFAIVQEDLALDDGFYYEIIAVEHGSMQITEEEAEFGPILLKHKHPMLKDFLSLKHADLTRLLEGLEKQKSAEAIKRKEKLVAKIAKMEKVIQCL
ncbi:MAG: class I SAM-dependent methyltransferase [Clostridia bacterium]|jgi:tRNA (adenine22-N1)-methyltransferase|nr:class I SAM-dependent methyltransferase [Clostridia bacterium]MDD4570876.1 class I SAM-dependent methyltransferase [Clostridia bacterium]